MTKEKCINCGRFLGSYSAEVTQDWKGIKKGDTVDIRGCTYCEEFTVEGHTPKKKKEIVRSVKAAA